MSAFVPGQNVGNINILILKRARKCLKEVKSHRQLKENIEYVIFELISSLFKTSNNAKHLSQSGC